MNTGWIVVMCKNEDHFTQAFDILEKHGFNPYRGTVSNMAIVVNGLVDAGNARRILMEKGLYH